MISCESRGRSNEPDKASFKEDNLDIATRMMVDKGEGKELLQATWMNLRRMYLAVDPAIDKEFC